MLREGQGEGESELASPKSTANVGGALRSIPQGPPRQERFYNGFFAGMPGLRGYCPGVAATLSITTR